MLSLAGMLAIAASVFIYEKTTPFPSLYALLPVAGTCAVLLFARQWTIVGSLLSFRPIVGIGLISYSAYLYHQPLFAFARIRSLTEPAWQIMLLLSAVSIALGYLSWRYVEIPARQREFYLFSSRKITFSTLGLMSAAILAVSLAGRFSLGTQIAADANQARVADLYTGKYRSCIRARNLEAFRASSSGNRAPAAGAGDRPPPVPGCQPVRSAGPAAAFAAFGLLSARRWHCWRWACCRGRSAGGHGRRASPG